jgi:hypothetical protein
VSYLGGIPWPTSVTGAGGGSSFPWASLLSGILPSIGSLFDQGTQSSLNQMQSSESQISSQLMNMISGLNNDFAKYYQPAMGAESTSVIGDLGATSQNIPMSDAVYTQMAKTGLAPQVQQNAMSQLLQGFQSSLNDIEAQATPGGNVQAAKQAAQNSYLSSAANQSAQLAGESQQMKAQGAQGLASNAFNALNAANAFTGQGINMEGMSMQGLDSLYQSLAQQAAAYAQSAQSGGGMGGGIGSILGQIASFAPMFM